MVEFLDYCYREEVGNLNRFWFLLEWKSFEFNLKFKMNNLCVEYIFYYELFFFRVYVYSVR